RIVDMAASARARPAALEAGGTRWLHYAIGCVPPAVSAALVRLWPLLLIAGVLDLLVPERRPREVPFVAFAAALILLAALFWPAARLAGAEDVVNRELPAQTRRVTFELHASSPVTNVTAAGSDDTLVTARFTGEPGGTVDVSAGPETRVRVRPRRAALPPMLGRARWDVEVPRGVPLDLRVDGGSGPLTLDLLRTQLS